LRINQKKFADSHISEICGCAIAYCAQEYADLTKQLRGAATFANLINDTGGKFATSVNELPIFPQIFEQIRNGPKGILRGLGETDS
jgi:hypothetical protein